MEWLIVGSGLMALGATVLAHSLQIPGMSVSFVSAIKMPPLPLLPVAGILLAALPAIVAPAQRAVPASSRREFETVAVA